MNPLDYIVVVKKTFRLSNVFFYIHLYRHSIFWNIVMKSSIKSIVSCNANYLKGETWKKD
jgi:hypothetical protein